MYISCEVVAYFGLDGEVYPIRFKVAGEDGEKHEYRITAYRQLSAKDRQDNNIYSGIHMATFEVKAEMHGREQVLLLRLDQIKLKWEVQIKES